MPSWYTTHANVKAATSCSKPWWRRVLAPANAAAQSISPHTSGNSPDTAMSLIAWQEAHKRLRSQQQQAKEMPAKHLRAVLATMIEQRRSCLQQQQTHDMTACHNQREQWEQAWRRENSIRRLKNLCYMLHHDIAPFHLCTVDLNFWDKSIAVIISLPWMLRSRSKLYAWELQQLPRAAGPP